MKYDIITELQAKGLIDALDFEEMDALRKMIKGIDHGPNSVAKDETDNIGLIGDATPTYLSISKRGRRVEKASDPKQSPKCQAVVELLPAGLCNFTVTKFDEDGYRILCFRTSTKKTHVHNQLEIRYYDHEATTCCGRNTIGELEESHLQIAGIIPDEEELIQLPDGIKGSEEIIDYINAALTNPNDSYSAVAKKLAEKGRIGKDENSENVIFVNISGNIQINRNNKVLVSKFVL